MQTGISVSFWWDFWLPFGTLQSFVIDPLAGEQSSLSVADVHPFGGDWLLDKISFVILECILLEMIAAPFSLNPLAEDMIV